jgi:molecular chaperone GrpE
VQEQEEKSQETEAAQAHDRDPKTVEDTTDTESAEPVAEGQPGEDGASEPDWKKVAEERYDRLLRLQADFENFRRRMDREREEWVARIAENLLADLLPVYDNLERAVKFMPNDGEAKAWRVGVEMTLKGFEEALSRLGVTPIAAVGQHFDPRFHEAVQQVDSDQPEGIVVEEVVRGFQWRDRVLRASRVKVSQGPALQSQSESAES